MKVNFILFISTTLTLEFLKYLFTAGPFGLRFPTTLARTFCPPLPEPLAPAMEPSAPCIPLLPIKPSFSGDKSSSSSESSSSPEETPSTPVVYSKQIST